MYKRQDQERAHAGNGRLDGLRAAHDAFYRGDIAAAIVRHQRENGGLLAAEDLASFQASFEPPCHTRFADFDVYGCCLLYTSITAKELAVAVTALTAVQLVPSLVERKMALPVPAKRFVPLTARE